MWGFLSWLLNTIETGKRDLGDTSQVPLKSHTLLNPSVSGKSSITVRKLIGLQCFSHACSWDKGRKRTNICTQTSKKTHYSHTHKKKHVGSLEVWGVLGERLVFSFFHVKSRSLPSVLLFGSFRIDHACKVVTEHQTEILQATCHGVVTPAVFPVFLNVLFCCTLVVFSSLVSCL